MDKRVLIVAGVLVVALAAVLIVRSQRSKPPTRKAEAKPFPELQAERPKGDPKWVHPAIKKIDKIEVSKGGTTLEIKRTKEGDGRRTFGEWQILKPYKYRADDYAVRQVIQRATTLRYWEPASSDPKEHGSLGVNDAKGMRIKLFEGTRKMADFYIGNEVKTKLNDRPMTYVYFRAAHQKTVWKVMGSLRLLTKKEMSAWRDPKILHLKRDDVVEITLATKDASLHVKRDPKEKDPKKKMKNWVIVSAKPEIKTVEQSDLSRIASTLSYLRTKDFADKVTPAKSGLDQPTHTLAVTTKDKKAFTLLFGKEIEQEVQRGKRKVKEKLIYVQVKGKKQVFLVQESRLRALRKAPMDLRDRTVIKLADNQKVVKIEAYLKDEHIVVARKGAKWVAEKPKDLKLDGQALDRDLKMLAGRFTAKEFAKETDPKKTGLDKPEGRLVLTVETTPKAKDAKKGAKKDAKAPAAKPVVSVIELLVGKEAAKRERYVQVKGQADVLVMRQYTLQRLWKGKGKWKPQRRPPGRMGGRMPGRMGGRMPGRMRMPTRMPRRGR